MIVTTEVISIDPNYWFTLQTPKYMNLHKWDHSSSKQASTTYNYYIGIKRKVSYLQPYFLPKFDPPKAREKR